MKIAITGGIGSGKTTISNMIIDKGFPVYNSDKRMHFLQNNNLFFINELKKIFGDDIYKKDESGNLYVDKKRMSSIVFSDKSYLDKLNITAYKYLVEDINLFFLNNKSEKLIFVETALLFEAHLEYLFDKIILVTAPYDIRFERVMERDKRSPEQLKTMMNTQLDEEIKKKKSNFIINNLNLDDSRSQVEQVITKLFE
jgi:dephospho-CoA kinase